MATIWITTPIILDIRFVDIIQSTSKFFFYSEIMFFSMLFVVFLTSTIRGELFEEPVTAHIFRKEANLVDVCRDYVAYLENKTIQICTTLEQARVRSQNINETKSFDRVRVLLERCEEALYDLSYLAGDTKLFDDVDLTGILDCLVLLINTYKLSVESLTEGKLCGKKVSREFTAEECYEVALEALKCGDYCASLEWLHAAVKRGVAFLPLFRFEEYGDDFVLESTVMISFKRVQCLSFHRILGNTHRP